MGHHIGYKSGGVGDYYMDRPYTIYMFKKTVYLPCFNFYADVLTEALLVLEVVFD